MQYLLDKVMSNPMYITIGVILTVVLFYAIFKRILKLLIFLFIAIILFLVYVNNTGNTVTDKIEKMIK